MNHSCAPKKALKLPYLPFPGKEKKAGPGKEA
jgi:hypothetical protein